MNSHFNPVAIYQRVLAAASIEKPEELLVTQLPPNPEVLEKGLRAMEADGSICGVVRQPRADGKPRYTALELSQMFIDRDGDLWP